MRAYWYVTGSAYDRQVPIASPMHFKKISFMAAIDTLLRIILRPGDHAILGNDAYGGMYRLLNNDYGQWGIELDTQHEQKYKRKPYHSFFHT